MISKRVAWNRLSLFFLSCLFFAANIASTQAAPAVSATESATYPLNNDNSARPGDTITYSGTIQNSGTTDATGVQLADTLDPQYDFRREFDQALAERDQSFL